MSSSEILEAQIKEMRDDLASANRAFGYIWARLHDANAVADQLQGGNDVKREIEKAMAVCRRGDIGETRETCL